MTQKDPRHDNLQADAQAVIDGHSGTWVLERMAASAAEKHLTNEEIAAVIQGAGVETFADDRLNRVAEEFLDLESLRLARPELGESGEIGNLSPSAASGAAGTHERGGRS